MRAFRSSLPTCENCGSGAVFNRTVFLALPTEPEDQSSHSPADDRDAHEQAEISPVKREKHLQRISDVTVIMLEVQQRQSDGLEERTVIRSPHVSSNHIPDWQEKRGEEGSQSEASRESSRCFPDAPSHGDMPQPSEDLELLSLESTT